MIKPYLILINGVLYTKKLTLRGAKAVLAELLIKGVKASLAEEI